MDRAEVVNALHTNDSSGLTAQAAERLMARLLLW